MLRPEFERFNCQERVLRVIHSAHLPMSKDSKNFVDMPLKYSKQEVERAFAKLERNIEKMASERERRECIGAFVEDYFLKAGSDLESITPTDWLPSPPTLCDALRGMPAEFEFSIHLNALWKSLARRVKSCVALKPECHTLLHVPHPFMCQVDASGNRITGTPISLLLACLHAAWFLLA